MRPTVVVVPEPVITRERARLHCKLSSFDQLDEELADAIETARAWTQEHLQRAIGRQTLRYTYTEWSGSTTLPYDIVSVTATAAGVATPATFVDRTVTVDGAAPVVLDLVTGDDAASLPGPIKSAMLLMIADLMENRQGQAEVKLYENQAVENLLSLYRERSYL
ncbi:MAG: phage gp6-like head-tail connector protein [Proteobacteria bacterium]|nr:phage gp6-like head-tail connector protein [Pseudomonadota bacterium]